MKKNLKLFSSVAAIEALRLQARADLVRGFYGRSSRKVLRRKAGRVMGFREAAPCRKK